MGLAYNTVYSTNPTVESLSSVAVKVLIIMFFFIYYRKFASMKVKLLFFFSFVLASAALVQHAVLETNGRSLI